MRSKRFHNERRLYNKRDRSPVRQDPHKAFVESLKKQIPSDTPSIASEDSTKAADDDVFSNEIIKKIEAKLEALFADLDDDDN